MEIKRNSLTDEQAKAVNTITELVKEGKRKIILNGSAGTGKTYLINELILSIKKVAKSGTIAYITSPTNRAVEVIKGKVDTQWWMRFSTIHKALFMKRFINGKTGEISFKPSYNPSKEKPFHRAFVVIIDEASMLNSEILLIIEQAEFNDIPIIFIGDNKQLNPVNETHSPVFERMNLQGETIRVKIDNEVIDYQIPEYKEVELTEIIRQKKDNSIIKLSYNLGNIGLMKDNINENGEGYEYTNSYNRCLDEVCKNENSRYLAWTNEAVDKFNHLARLKLWKNPAKIENNEIIIFKQPYSGFDEDYNTSAEIRVESVEVIEDTFAALKEFKGKNSLFKTSLMPKLKFYWVNSDIKIIHEDSQREYSAVLRKLKSLTTEGLSWKVWFDFYEMFAQVGYRYSTTVHKAQGGTFDTVYINMNDINRNKNVIERKRLWYTAVTRASDKIVFYNNNLI